MKEGRYFLISSCFLIKCLKGHKSLGSLCTFGKTLIVSLVGRTDQAGTKSPIELFWIAKKLNCKDPPEVDVC